MQIEPHADIREAAGTLFQMYTAFTQAGFTDVQAMQMIVTTLSTNYNSGEK